MNGRMIDNETINNIKNSVDIVDIKNMDLVGLSKTEFSGRFDVVITNPPYKKSNTGLKNKNESKNWQNENAAVSSSRYSCVFYVSSQFIAHFSPARQPVSPLLH